MSPRQNNQFITKMMAAIILSAGFTSLIVAALYYLMAMMQSFNPSSSFIGTKVLNWSINHIGSTPMLVIAFLTLFIFGFLYFSKGIVTYMNEILSSLQEMESGNLDYRIPVRTSDEFGLLAERINTMAHNLKQSMEEERAAVKTKNDLITGVSHDLRTPLTSIIGYLEYIENDRYHDEVEMRQYVRIAYEKSLGLKSLIDDLFEYSRLSSIDRPLKLDKLEMNHFLRQLAEEFVPSFEQAGLHCRVKIESGPLCIMGESDELVRVYENLFSNAIRYGKDGKYLDLVLRRDGEDAVITVTNYGEPIPAEDLPYIFDRFYRSDKSRTKTTGGSGLGLAIAKSIVEANKGTITARSNESFTAFETRFRCCEAEEPA